MATKDLLPNYMKAQVWLDLCDAIDHVFTDVNVGAKVLKNLRTMYISNEALEEKVANRELLSFSDFDLMEREIVIKQTNLLGLNIQNTDILTEADFNNINRNLGQFWYSKGLHNFIDFVGFCLNVRLEMFQTWTENYQIFLEDGDQNIGTPIWNGGTWFPTTHVKLQFDAGRFASVPIPLLINLFYDIANYNLIIESIVLNVYSYMTIEEDFDKQPDPVDAKIVNLGMFQVVEQHITNYD